MKWFDKWFAKKCKQAWNTDKESISEEGYINLPTAKLRSNSVQGSTLDSDANLQFTVYNAVGGKVVEFRRYDRQRDRSDYQVYVISTDQDFGERIAKIATLEAFKQ